MKKHYLLAAFALASCLASATLQAADFDGSKPLICATIDAHDCDPGLTCQRSLPAELGAPQFLRIDFAKKTIAGPQRTTPIHFMDNSPAEILMQGVEFGFAWTIVIDKASGELTMTLLSSEDALVLFGSCTPL
ncbi:hypothetical protein [Pararobbsia alpina]|uniref:Uncharacterized protein n=1 Tax=Pararobbsia alpina TaxID=621374 RepID=A0A6S7AVF6_9BURK|nr:hypothetical protein [Pararobbsia alpina]CAB3776778.1 hypothetical protein LMG28138_00219 [Pararobbsia alpina]